MQYIADQVPAKKLAQPNGTIERTKLQAWLNFFSSEMHKGAFGPLFYRGILVEPPFCGALCALGWVSCRPRVLGR